ncbi:MAG: tetratricopeptide repeat protein [Chloroflexota bacterium]
MEQSSLQVLLEKGIAAARAGQGEQARQILLQVIDEDETNVPAWLWLSAVVDDPTDKFVCLQNVLKLDPANKPAQIGLARLEQGVSRRKPALSRDPARTKATPPELDQISPSVEPAQTAKTPPLSPTPPASAAVNPTPVQDSPKKQYKKLTPNSPPPPPSPPRPAHLKEHPSIAAALLKKEYAAPHPPPDEDAPAGEPFSEDFVAVVESEPEVGSRPPLDGRRTLLRAAIILFSLLLCAPCSILGGLGVFNELALQQQGKIVEARVLEHRIQRIANGAQVYQVRYQFSLDGKTWYSYADETGREDLWASVSKSDWDTAWSTKRLKVLYLPRQPEVNRPLNVSEHVSLLGDPLMAIALGVGVSSIFLAGGIALTMFFPRRSTRPTLPERIALPRYQRVSSPDSKQPPTPVKRAAHVQEHASLAAALSQKKPPPPGESTAGRGAGERCPFCRQSISTATIYCFHCNLPLVVDCPACGSRQDVEIETCAECGQELGDFRRKTAYFAGLAAAYQEHQHYKKSFDLWQVVGRLGPDFPELRLRLAEAQAGSGRAEAAVMMLRQVLAEEPGQEQASLVLGKILHELSYKDEARAVYEQALTVSPGSAELHFALGWLLAEYGSLKQGLAHLHKATQFDPTHGLAWFRLGQLYEAWGESKKAVTAFRKAAALLPEQTLVQQKAQGRVGALNPDLPLALATGWLEFSRQAAGPVLICILTALLDAGLRPWWIPWPGWLALFLGISGSLLWVSGISLPRNPAICYLVGRGGIESSAARLATAVVGGVCWLAALIIILAPIGQTYPEVPAWILKP